VTNVPADHVNQVPETTIERLPVYLRCLHEAQAMRIPVISSEGIAQMAGGNAAQVRKDLNYLGELGTRGIGYEVDSLAGHIARALGLTQQRRVALVGLGRLGGALLSYGGFGDRGLTWVAVYDADPDKIGSLAGSGLSVLSIDDLAATLPGLGPDIAVITTPAQSAQSVADALVAAGIRSILNFAPVTLDVPAQVTLRQVDLSVELQILSFHLAEGR
jgi:redox-sensing transcriptional repressor